MPTVKTRLLQESVANTLEFAKQNNRELPFSVYRSHQEQRIFNVPIPKPLLIFVLGGEKHLGKQQQVTCHTDEFVFLSNNGAIDMRNIPRNTDYYALIIEFDEADFKDIEPKVGTHKPYFIGQTSYNVQLLLLQFIEYSRLAPSALWPARKKELLAYLYHLGYSDIPLLISYRTFKLQVHNLIMQNLPDDLSVEKLCNELAMSESTLRRRIKSESTTLQEIKDQARLGYGLHLLQSTMNPVGLIADRCGYQSQSRFSERFKARFGLTPMELRKTRMNE